MNRYHYFYLGLLAIFLGVQLRVVDSFVLNERTTRVLSGESDDTPLANGVAFQRLMTGGSASSGKVVQPPRWLGWCLLSVGAVLILHSLALPKPGG